MDLTEISGVGEKTASVLIRHGIGSLSELLAYYPRSYREYHAATTSSIVPGDWVSLVGTISKPTSHHTGRLTTQTAVLTDSEGKITLRWFNMPYLTRTLSPDSPYLVHGHVTEFAGRRQLVAPQLTKVTEGYLAQDELAPIYSACGSLKSGNLRKIIHAALEAPLEDSLPEALRNQYSLLDLSQALHQIHFPRDRAEAEAAIHRLAFDELYALQLEALKNRELNKIHTEGLRWDQGALTNWLQSLPFTPTASQSHAISDIIADLQQDIAMHRLLQGEVGSGKTLVAATAALATHLAGKQTLLMAPTQILAEQLYSAMSKFLGDICDVALVTHEVKGDTHAPLVVGTQALLQEKHSFGSIGLVVVDEQHRFGVEQRLLLTRFSPAPHFLMMTATPIPRSLAMTVFIGLDITRLTELPSGRLPVKTFYVEDSKRAAAYDWIRREVAHSENRAFVVVPLIDEAEDEDGNEKKSLALLEKDLRSRFPKLPIDIMHGRMKENEKNRHLHDFRDGITKILVATSMVEVGIDIPTANLMVIEDADRFGLAQLHQLRGRVGRGGGQGYCLLFSNTRSRKAKDRLAYFVRETDGAKLAEYDLKSRGPGELFGLSQHGFFNLKLASLYDEELLRETHEAAKMHSILP